jgi:hypothetical protein
MIGKMHPTQEISNNSSRLFQREKSVKGEMIQDNRLIPTVFTVKSSPDVQPPLKIVSNIFYDNLKPFIFVMRVMGVSPVHMTSKGKDFHGHPTNYEEYYLLGYNAV